MPPAIVYSFGRVLVLRKRTSKEAATLQRTASALQQTLTWVIFIHKHDQLPLACLQLCPRFAMRRSLCMINNSSFLFTSYYKERVKS
mmetsp:Transcript_10710/g.37186  ORF Transcript_10710/g.37186 Transcript_10710/m.37186 type:complete len:87 (-) Transcript_10710:141-401(-)